jgi:two-component system response regulator (stage 0 sporulation protein F)
MALQSRVVVVDDDPEVLEVIKKFLVQRKFEVHTAISGEGALPLIRAVRPHLVLLDLRLPGLDGVETLREIRRFDSTVGVIMMTGYEDEEKGRESLDLGASDCIRKPIDLKYLEASVMQKIRSMVGE